MSQIESNKEFDKRAHLYDFIQNLSPERTEEIKLWTDAQLKAIRKLIIDKGIDLRNSTIIDMGGGTGRIAFPLSQECKKLILVEPSEKMLLAAQGKLNHEKHGNIEFLQKGFLDINLPKDTADVIISINDPFQFLLEKQEQLVALEKMMYFLKPGGILILEIMNFFSAKRSTSAAT